MPTGDLARFFCQAPDSDACCRRGGDKLLVIEYFGMSRRRLLYCRADSVLAISRAPRSSTPNSRTTRVWRSWSPWPTAAASARSPCTSEFQLYEKWSFVAKKQHNCDPADPDDDHRGDNWDCVAFDPERRLVLVVIPGARAEGNGPALVAEVKKQLGNEAPA